jgi:ribosome-binding protein aMBF1 (putative translation factor)
MNQKDMNFSGPRIRHSEILAELRNGRDPLESAKIRASMILAARIATVMKEKEWTKERLARELRKSVALVCKMLSGSYNFDLNTLLEIEACLEVDLVEVQEA